MRGRMVRIFAAVERDLKKFRRNPLVIAMSIILPILYLIILGNSFQGKLRALPLAVANLDTGPHARKIMENLRAVEAGPAILTILMAANEEAVMDGIRKGRFTFVILGRFDHYLQENSLIKGHTSKFTDTPSMRPW